MPPVILNWILGWGKNNHNWHYLGQLAQMNTDCGLNQCYISWFESLYCDNIREENVLVLRKFTLKYLRVEAHDTNNILSDGSEKEECMWGREKAKGTNVKKKKFIAIGIFSVWFQFWFWCAYFLCSLSTCLISLFQESIRVLANGAR